MEQLAIFASGGGSNAQAIIDYFEGNEEIKIALIVTNNQNAGVIDRGRKHKLPVFIHAKDDMNNGILLQALRIHGVSFVILAGYLKMISPDLSKAYHNKMVNIHPALLPKYGGKGMYGMNVHRAVFENKEEVSGITIHYVNERYDEGEIILQESCDIRDCSSPEEIQKAVLKVEHEFFAPTIEKLLIKD
ncbi:MAG: phosphoribosylglycinamide formyltransferase [Crocinitomicaceae bacterium]|nr:phosphoribosylglycinamide formyltransferase [Crocinitomicaceae bacterium]